jgi:hypothetical protein
VLIGREIIVKGSLAFPNRIGKVKSICKVSVTIDFGDGIGIYNLDRNEFELKG